MAIFELFTSFRHIFALMLANKLSCNTFETSNKLNKI